MPFSLSAQTLSGALTGASIFILSRFAHARSCAKRTAADTHQTPRGLGLAKKRPSRRP